MLHTMRKCFVTARSAGCALAHGTLGAVQWRTGRLVCSGNQMDGRIHVGTRRGDIFVFKITLLISVQSEASKSAIGLIKYDYDTPLQSKVFNKLTLLQLRNA